MSTLSSITRIARASFVFIAVGTASAACGGDDPPPPPPPENAGSSCTAPAQCYTTLEAGAIKGEVRCLDRVTGGYCTHLCTADADCCAVPGECRLNAPQVCAPFESTGMNFCFVSCDDNVIKTIDPAFVGKGTEYCHKYASTTLGCRATGGGNPKKVCAAVG